MSKMNAYDKGYQSATAALPEYVTNGKCFMLAELWESEAHRSPAYVYKTVKAQGAFHQGWMQALADRQESEKHTEEKEVTMSTRTSRPARPIRTPEERAAINAAAQADYEKCMREKEAREIAAAARMRELNPNPYIGVGIKEMNIMRGSFGCPSGDHAGINPFYDWLACGYGSWMEAASGRGLGCLETIYRQADETDEAAFLKRCQDRAEELDAELHCSRCYAQETM